MNEKQRLLFLKDNKTVAKMYKTSDGIKLEMMTALMLISSDPHALISTDTYFDRFIDSITDRHNKQCPYLLQYNGVELVGNYQVSVQIRFSGDSSINILIPQLESTVQTKFDTVNMNTVKNIHKFISGDEIYEWADKNIAYKLSKEDAGAVIEGSYFADVCIGCEENESFLVMSQCLKDGDHGTWFEYDFRQLIDQLIVLIPVFDNDDIRNRLKELKERLIKYYDE